MVRRAPPCDSLGWAASVAQPGLGCFGGLGRFGGAQRRPRLVAGRRCPRTRARAFVSYEKILLRLLLLLQVGVRDIDIDIDADADQYIYIYIYSTQIELRYRQARFR